MNNFAIISVTNELRYFLFESPCITDIFKKYTDKKIDFCVNGEDFNDDAEDEASAFFLWKQISPIDDDTSKMLSRQEFLNFPCIQFNATSYKVIDIIKFYAFVRGGIHLKPKPKNESSDLQSVFDLLTITTPDGNISILDQTMAQIIDVAVEGIENYYEETIKNL